MANEKNWPVSVTRPLALSLALVIVSAGAAAAQLSRDHSRPRYEKSSKGASIDDSVKQLSSENPEIRLAAVKALGASKDTKAIDPLIKAIGDSDVRVRAKAIQVLGDMRAGEATPVLVQYLFLGTTDADMKQLILASLGKIGDPRAAQPVAELLRRDLDTTTRATAIYALGEIGAPESVDALAHMAQTDADQTLRRLAAEAKSKIEAHHTVINAPVKDPSEPFLEPKEPPPRQPGQADGR